MESPSVTGSEMIYGNNSLASKASCFDVCNDDLLLKLGPGRLRYSAIAFQHGDISDSSSSDQTEEDAMVLNCQTPIHCICDLFTPGPGKSMSAPKKMRKSSYLCDSEENVETHAIEDLEEQYFLESTFSSLLELIVSTQMNEILAEKDSDLPEDCKTPTSVHLMTAVAETCPPAPVKLISNMKMQHRIVRRKIDFSSTWK
ncbi:hypothetical protein AXF42_Ash008352 [Apostasia shenzhenica]|uniref:Uncharacterized protein n=1 Tax=Apostasia shenzhenica TaxID=1088818 RepID=A0A2I0AXL8_9ASPA|nr:hypothetical protein AXF42_Ash008352 [Apostasia shenzhenica]